MSNFNFLRTEFSDIYKEAYEAEKSVIVAPRYTALLCRCALEKAVIWIYANDDELEEPYDKKLASLIHEHSFRDILKPSMFREINLIRLTGNNAAHGKKVLLNESMISIKNLFRFLSFLAIYYSEDEASIPLFDECYIPDGKQTDKSKLELVEMEKQLDAVVKERRDEQERIKKQAKEIEELKFQLEDRRNIVTKRRISREKSPGLNKAIPELISEAVTRRVYIDLLLKEAGWSDLREGKDIEFEVEGMPVSTNPSGKGFVDYVLWGDNGLPLAVVEAKRAMLDSRKGKHQAVLYADCLERMYSQRPVIFYTNGFETYIWDDNFYTERSIQGFYSKNELQLLVDRRRTRTNICDFKINTDIAGFERPYQLEAIQRVAEVFAVVKDGKLKGSARKALLVMATGSGKTRVSAAIVDMLIKCNWVKRVLFLADRNALVSQAKNVYKDLLPNLSTVDLTKEKEESGTRIVFSTYQTIINKIDGVKTDDNRFYSVGHFDLIIIDEAHRSVYQKYGAIFEYFDSLLVGLTATPKSDVDKNTYELFGIEDDNPTAAYELSDAVAEGHLVAPKFISMPTKFQLEGVKYNDLSKREKVEYELKLGDPTQGEVDDNIDGSALHSWLFNSDTVDKILSFVMTNGIKVDGGDKLGKTIIFAKNHKHALFIEQRFNKLYAEYSGGFLRVIDNYESKAQDLLEDFCEDKNEIVPQIAVSVDMMDTGVDAPRVLNLVFFKPVKSYTKFWQMIGRGTRLRKDLFGPGDDKKDFLIFDCCENFEFFDSFPDGVSSKMPKSLSQQIFETKLNVAHEIRCSDLSDKEADLAEIYIDDLHSAVAVLNQNRFEVRAHLRIVNEYTDKKRWENISKGDIADICASLSALPVIAYAKDEQAKRFDLMMLKLQLAVLLDDKSRSSYESSISSLASLLMKKKNIPLVAKSLPTIKAVQTEEFWKDIDLCRLEKVREDLRDLIKLIDRDKQKIVYTNFEDSLEQFKDVKSVYLGDTRLKTYKERLELCVLEHKDNIVVHKLNTNEPITALELVQLEKIIFREDVGGKDEYLKEYGDLPLGCFVRSILGLDTKVANKLFASFIHDENLSVDKMSFINVIIKYLSKNGVIEPSMLFESPFTDIDDSGLGIFSDDKMAEIVSIVEEIKENAMIG